jgi:hypothetical protein
MADPKIFLSYAHDETPFARSVAHSLRARGVELSLDAHEVAAGEKFADQLSTSLRSSSVVVVFLGKTVKSPWVNFEIGAAIGQSKPVLPVFLSHEARELAPPSVSRLDGIDASNLTPEQVADRIADALPIGSGHAGRS